MTDAFKATLSDGRHPISDGDTITVSSTTYTFRKHPTQPNDIQIQRSVKAMRTTIADLMRKHGLKVRVAGKRLEFSV